MMNNYRVIKKSSLSGVFCRILPNDAALISWEKQSEKRANILKLLALVPRAGLEPARPLFTKLRILSPDEKKDKSFHQLDFHKKSEIKSHQKVIKICRIKASPVAILCAYLFNIKDHNFNFQLKNSSRGEIAMEHIEVRIRKFGTLIKRADIKTPNWFAVEHNILLHPDFFDISGDEFKVFIWVLGVATHLNSEAIRVYPEVCASQIRVKKNIVELTISKLNGKRWDVTDTSRGSTDNFKVTNPTGEYRTVQDSEGQDSEGNVLALSGQPGNLPKLIEIWNLLRGDLPEVKAATKSRKKAIAKAWPDLAEADWRLVVSKIAASDFCCGRTKSGDWKANFDWMLKAKKDDPANYLKVLEGNYDNRTSPAQLFQNPANAKWAMGEK